MLSSLRSWSGVAVLVMCSRLKVYVVHRFPVREYYGRKAGTSETWQMPAGIVVASCWTD